MKPGFEAVIGLEVHVQLLTRSKMFCGCANVFGAPPNTLTCPVCLGLPGALPVLNGAAVRMAIQLGLALGAEIREESRFYRKQYFYPDLPKGYQITQGPVALVEGGHLEIPSDPAVRGREGPIPIRIERAHLEEDAGKSHHDRSDAHSLVDLNRAGVPLLEVVGAPDLRSPQEASDYLKALHRLVTFLGICDGNMEEGSFRCDANVSVRPAGTMTLGSRVEVKNLNSFRHVRQALDHEIGRHIQILESGGAILQETRGWDAEKAQTWSQRTKEAAMDYRFFPEPDLPLLTLAPGDRAEALAALPELPRDRQRRLAAQHALTDYEAGMLLQNPAFADFFEALALGCGNGKQAANWLLGEVSRALNERGTTLSGLGLGVPALAELIRLVEVGTLNLSTAKEVVFPALLAGTESPARFVEEQGLAQVSDLGAIERLVREVFAVHPEPLAQWKAGNPKLRGFLVGQVMKAGRGRMNPQRVNEVIDAIAAE